MIDFQTRTCAFSNCGSRRVCGCCCGRNAIDINSAPASVSARFLRFMLQSFVGSGDMLREKKASCHENGLPFRNPSGPAVRNAGDAPRADVCRGRHRGGGVRTALGARTRDVVALVLKQGVLITVCGLTIGMDAAGLIVRSLCSILYGV